LAAGTLEMGNVVNRSRHIYREARCGDGRRSYMPWRTRGTPWSV